MLEGWLSPLGAGCVDVAHIWEDLFADSQVMTRDEAGICLQAPHLGRRQQLWLGLA